MLKFRCQHCGQRIAVPARHLGKLVTCAECGAQTHPLAEQIVVQSRKPDPAKPKPTRAPAAQAATPACANCAQPLGRLQATHEWEDQKVCAPCYHRLSDESTLSGNARPTKARPVVATRVHPPAPGPAPLLPPAGSPYASQHPLGLRERVTRGVMVFVVGAVAVYGALTLLRDIAGLIAVAAVAILALFALYGLFRSKLAARFRTRATPPGGEPASADGALVAVRSR